jgi:hypothetical protein
MGYPDIPISGDLWIADGRSKLDRDRTLIYHTKKGNVSLTFEIRYAGQIFIYLQIINSLQLLVTVAIISVGDNRLSGISSFGSDAGNLLGYLFGHSLLGLNRLLGGLDTLDAQQLGFKDYDID